MKTSATCTWQGKMAFSTELGGHQVATDASVAYGGDNGAASPKSLMMAALAGCTGVDVVTILGKMRMPFSGLTIGVEAELTDEVPAVFRSMHLVYSFTGEEIDADKAKKAVQLSQDKYCGVSFMYRRIMELSWEIVINGQKVV